MSNMKPGDWMCAACGDHVFARNTECRKCGTSKGAGGGGCMGGGMGGGMNPMAAMMQMMMGGGGMGGGGGGGGGMGSNHKPGDWNCPGCGDHQFARNTECRKCGTANPGGGGAGMMNGAGGAGKGQKPGDWFCPGCNDLQFARNTECRKCSTPNPDPAGSAAAKEAGLAAGQVALGENLKPGDWYCPGCNDLNFAKNAQCRKCKTPNPDAAASIEAASASGNFRPAGGKGGNNQEKKPGDWNCTGCGDLQFARNTECRKCGTPNMSGGKGGGGGMGGGNQAANPAMMMQMMQMMGTMMGQMGQNQNAGNQMGGMMGGMQQQQPQQQQQMGDPNCKWCVQGQCWTHGQGKGGHGRAGPY